MLQRATRYARRAPGQRTILLTALVLLCMATGLADVLDGGLLAKARAAVSQPEAQLAVSAAIVAWQDWLTAHRVLRGLDDGGSYNDAIRFATVDPTGTQPRSASVDSDLGQAIRQATDRFTGGTDRARDALAGVDTGVAILTVLAILGLALGFAPRLREFR